MELFSLHKISPPLKLQAKVFFKNIFRRCWSPDQQWLQRFIITCI